MRFRKRRGVPTQIKRRGEMLPSNGYSTRRYHAFNDGPNFMDVIKAKAGTAASNIVGGAANAAAGSVNNAVQGIKMPNVNVAITKETKQMVYKGATILATGLVIAAIAFRR